MEDLRDEFIATNVQQVHEINVSNKQTELRPKRKRTSIEDVTERKHKRNTLAKVVADKTHVCQEFISQSLSECNGKEADVFENPFSGLPQITINKSIMASLEGSEGESDSAYYQSVFHPTRYPVSLS